jgi:hypothetical protein
VIWMFLVAAGQANMAPIQIPYQAQPAFIAYSNCVGRRAASDPRSHSGKVAEVRQANADALAACRDVRASELARGLAAVDDKDTLIAPPFHSRVELRQAVNTAFDRYDADFDIR